jgi:Ca2+-binding EF-hand superfamily protein
VLNSRGNHYSAATVNQASSVASQDRPPTQPRGFRQDRPPSANRTEIQEERKNFGSSVRSTRPEEAKQSLRPGSRGFSSTSKFNVSTTTIRGAPTKHYANLSEREKAEAYFELYDKNQELRKDHNVMDQRIKELTTALSRLQGDVKYERTLAESYTGQDFHSSLVHENEERVRLERENEELKSRLKQLRNSVTKGIKKKVGKKGPPSLAMAPYKPKVLSANPEHGDEHILIDKLKHQLLESEKEIQRLRAAPQHTQTVNTEPVHALAQDFKDKATQLAVIESKYSTLELSFESQRMYLESLKKMYEEAQLAVRNEKTRCAELEIKLRAAEMAATAPIDMAKTIEELRQENRKLENQIRELCQSPFVKDARNRVITGSRVTTLETELEKMTASIKEYKERSLKAESEVSRLDIECKKAIAERDTYKEQNLRLSVLLEEKSKKMDDFEEHLKAIATGGDLNTFMKALGLMKLRGEEPAWSQLDFLERNTMIPNDVAGLTREVERLKLEKGQIAAELEKVSSLLKVKNDQEKETAELHNATVEQLRIQLKAANQRAEELARLADFRANRVIQLERNQRLNTYDDANRIIGSKTELRVGDWEAAAGEFVEGDTEVGTDENVLDIWLGEGEYYEIALQQALRDHLAETGEYVTFIGVDFFDHETQTTSLCEGLRPYFNLHISYKVKVNDFFIKYLEKDFITLEVHASKGNKHVTFAIGKISLKEILNRTSPLADANTRTSMIESAVTLLNVKDNRTSMGVLRYKLRMRYPLSEALRWYKEKQDIVEIVHPKIHALDTSFQPTKPSLRRTLVVTIFRCSGLGGRGYPGDMRPFVYFQLFGDKEASTKVNIGPDPVWDDSHVFELEVTPELQKYLDKENLEFIVFDDNAPIRAPGDDIIGVAHVPLSSLLLDTAAEGNYTLYSNAGQPKGEISLRIAWRDSRADTYNYGTPLSQVWEKDIYERIARNLIERGLNMESSFSVFDQDQDGLISPQEFRTTLLITLRLPISEQEVQLLINSCNLLEGGITRTEFRNKFKSLIPEEGVGKSWEEAVLDKIRERIALKGLSIREAFMAFDLNKDGTVDTNEFRQTMRIMQLGLSDNEVERLTKWFDPRCTNRINYEIFCDRIAIEKTKISGWEEAVMDKMKDRIRSKGLNIRQAFQAFDLNRDGTIDADEFRKTFKIMQLGLTDVEIERILSYFDPRGNGKIMYEAFCARIDDTSLHGEERWLDSLIERLAPEIRGKGINVSQTLGLFDLKNDGTIDSTDFLGAIRGFDLSLSTEEINRLIRELDPKNTGRVSYRRFSDRFSRRSSSDVSSLKKPSPVQTPQIKPVPTPASKAPEIKSTPREELKLEEVLKVIQNSGIDLNTAFRVFDTDSDNFISCEEFIKIFEEMKLGLTRGQVEILLRKIDSSGDGKVSFIEFKRLFQSYGIEVREVTPGKETIVGRKKLRSVQEVFDMLDEYLKKHNMNLVRLFTQVFDSNHDAWISRPEAQKGFNMILAYPLTEQEMSDVMSEVCPPGQTRFNFNMLREAYLRFSKRGTAAPDSSRELLRQATDSMSKTLERSSTELRK